MEEQDREEISDSIDKKKGRKGGRFWAGVLVGALIMALAVLLVVGVSAGIYITGRKVIRTEQSSGYRALSTRYFYTMRMPQRWKSIFTEE